MTATGDTRRSPRPASAPRPARRRRSPGWVPNQHGAWAMLATPLLVGVLASTPRWVHLPLTAFWFAGYFAFFATGLWLKSHRRARYRPPAVAYAGASGLLGALTLVLRPDLVRWAPLFVLPLGVGLVASAVRADRSLWSGVATTAGSCLMTVVAYDAGGGSDWRRAWLLAAVLAAYFVGTVLYVKTVIRERGSRAHLWLSVAAHVAAALAVTVISPWLTVVFALLAGRAALAPALRLSPKAVGIGEIVATLLVSVTALVVV